MSGSETFSNPSFWKEYGGTPDYIERINIIHLLLPSGSNSLLDVGCGNGEMVNSLSVGHVDIKFMGMDPYLQALKFVNVPAIQSKLPQIPFGNKTFDILLCLQVLEHLEDKNYFLAIRELQRVARKYIIIGVPYKENLQTFQVLCSKCGQTSHAYGHVRVFSELDLTNLIPEFELKKTILAGVKQRRRSFLGMQIEHAFAHLYQTPMDFTCPYCHSRSPAISDRPLIAQWGARFVNKMFTLFSPIMPYWIIGFYSRKV
jgi:hypothetical protein